MPKIKSSKERQDPPNAVQLELVEGCSLNCTFCGVQGIREKKGGYKYMSPEVFGQFVSALHHSMSKHKWNPRIELAMHGEPTMHPDLIKYTRRIGKLKPREFILVTNGTGLAKNPSMVDKLAGGGITSFCLDKYEGCDFVDRFLRDYKGHIPIYDFTGPEAEKFRSNKNKKPPFIVVKGDVSDLTTPYDKVNTHCGTGCQPFRVNPSLHKRCAKPFREMSIRWDGNVALCCNDFRGIYKIGNIASFDGLDELWQHKRFEAARRMLYNGDRRFKPCQWCDAISPRVGLLPDKYGRKELKAPTAATQNLIALATSGSPYTKPVLRGWETEGNECIPDGLSIVGLGNQSIDK